MNRRYELIEVVKDTRLPNIIHQKGEKTEGNLHLVVALHLISSSAFFLFFVGVGDGNTS